MVEFQSAFLMVQNRKISPTDNSKALTSYVAIKKTRSGLVFLIYPIIVPEALVRIICHQLVYFFYGRQHTNSEKM